LKINLTIILLFISSFLFAQSDSVLRKKTDSIAGAAATTLRDSIKKDSSLLWQQTRDSLLTATDSAALADSLLKDSTTKKMMLRKNLSWQSDTAFRHLLMLNVFSARAGTANHIDKMDGELFTRENKDVLFYVFAGLFFLLGLVNITFPKYFSSIFRMFFQSSVRQKQTKEQMAQDNFPSLMLNLLFMLSSGVFIALVASQYKWIALPLWQMALYCTVLLAILYLGKYIFISVAGWLFNASAAASGYSFIVFLVNKIIGLVLLPLGILVAFSSLHLQQAVITAAACVVVILLIYRYVMSLSVIGKNLDISPIHFFIMDINYLSSMGLRI
jgi:hypothetical protein